MSEAHVAAAQRGLCTQPHRTPVWELEGLAATFLPPTGLDERPWGLFTQSFGAQGLGQCLCSAWRISLWRPSWLRRVKVGIGCPVTAGGYCLTGAGANISYLSEIKKKVCGSCSLTCLQPAFGKDKGWAPFYHGSVCCFLVKPAWSSLLKDQAC